MNAIILIGYRGVGKSTIASEIVHKLSSKQNVCKISLDEELAQKLGNLQAFVKANGWEVFRDEETKLLRNIVLPKGLSIIDCGGGIVERSENIPLLKKLGKVFYIKAGVQTIQERLQTTHVRLSLSGKQSFFDEIKGVLEYREPLYLQAADVVIESDCISITECANKIIEKLQASEV